jgi:Fe-S oxidoreductase
MPSMWATNVLRCLDCGKCTSACPVARYNHALSPRRIVRQMGDGRNGRVGEALWSCLTCMYCDTRCPQEVSITKIMPQMRTRVREAGDKPPFTRCGAMESIAVIQSQAEIPQNRLEWVPGDLNVDPASKTVLWVGCTPYFDSFYAENGVKTVDAVSSAIRILNAMGIAPALLKDERCCGHDALWGGEHDTFERLAQMNVQMFQRAKPELVLTVCPECSLTLGREYKERFGIPDCPVQHIAEYIAEHARELPVAAQPLKVTFEDPCRLGRHQGKYDEPRQALAAVPELQLQEMGHSRGRSICCAGNWLSCNQATKRIQTDLLKEAQATGSDLLVTACPKCMIHLKCAQSGDSNVPDIEIRDLATVVAGALADKAAPNPKATERG